MGYLGGPNFPDDPTDLGPLVPLPGGYIEVFEYLASVGFRGFEFFQYTQNQRARAPAHARGDPLVPRQRGAVSFGTHTEGWRAHRPARLVQPTTAGRRRSRRPHARAHDDRHRRRPAAATRATCSPTGETGRPGTSTSSAGALAAEGLRNYLPPGAEQLQFFNDPAHPSCRGSTASTGSRRTRTRGTCSSSRTSCTPTPAAPASPTPSTLPLGRRWTPGRRTAKRILAWHVKDGSRIVPPPAARRRARPRRPARQRFARGSRTRSFGRGPDRPGLPGRSRPGRRRATSASSTRSARRAPVLHHRERQRPGRRGRPRPLAAPRQVQPAEPAGAARRREGEGQEHGRRRGDLRERHGRGRRLTCACAPSPSPCVAASLGVATPA